MTVSTNCTHPIRATWHLARSDAASRPLSPGYGWRRAAHIGQRPYLDSHRLRPNGYNALQIAEVKGQWIDNAAKYDLYSGVQDNRIWASGDAGLTWPSEVVLRGRLTSRCKSTSLRRPTAWLPRMFAVIAQIWSAERCFPKHMEHSLTECSRWPDPPAPHPTPTLPLLRFLDIRHSFQVVS